jgi:hypothetical protein
MISESMKRKPPKRNKHGKRISKSCKRIYKEEVNRALITLQLLYVSVFVFVFILI